MSKYLDIIIIALLIVIFLEMCKRPVGSSQIISHYDTMWIKKDSVIHSNPKVIIKEGSLDTIILKEYLPDTSSISKLIVQYDKLLKEFAERKIYTDSAKIDTVGMLYITDTVATNKIEGRSIHYNYKLPFIIKTIPETKKNQWYFGWDIRGKEGEFLDELSGGIMLRNKKNHIFGATVGIGTDNQLKVGLSSYWLIKLH